MTLPNTPERAAYDARYYGMEDPPRGNYRRYGPRADPHWARPLANWLHERAPFPVLDLGCAFGHLVREIVALRPPKANPEKGRGEAPAWGIEWSDYCAANRVTGFFTQADARNARDLFGVWSFGTVITLDFLEHLPPADGVKMIATIGELTRPQGWGVHVIGAHNPADDLSAHLSDPTHVNHEPLAWYLAAFSANGFTVDEERTAAIRLVPAWKETDWNGRIFVLRKTGAPT